jgi:hypothetical protein
MSGSATKRLPWRSRGSSPTTSALTRGSRTANSFETPASSVRSRA